MIMSIGLIISAMFIFFFGNPGKAYNEKVTEWNPWHLFDPVSTYIFSIVALGSTIPVVKSAYYLLMESTPTYINLAELKTKCEEIDGVIDIHDIHVWDLKPGKTCMIAHVLARKGTERKVLV
jgi:Co/Zn/Cd efflux system component